MKAITLNPKVFIEIDNKFRKDFPNVIKNLEKTPDSLQITIRKELGNNYQAKRFKINW